MPPPCQHPRRTRRRRATTNRKRVPFRCQRLGACNIADQLGTEDKAIPPALQRFMAERASATIVEVPASHVSFVSQPDAATQLILQAVEATMPAAST